MKSPALLCWVGNGRQLSECEGLVCSFIHDGYAFPFIGRGREERREREESEEREERGENFIPKVQKRTLAFSMKLRF